MMKNCERFAYILVIGCLSVVLYLERNNTSSREAKEQVFIPSVLPGSGSIPARQIQEKMAPKSARPDAVDADAIEDEAIEVPYNMLRLLVARSGVMVIDPFYTFSETFLRLIHASKEEGKALNQTVLEELQRLKEIEASKVQLETDENDNQYYSIPAIPEAAATYISNIKSRAMSVLGTDRGKLMAQILDLTMQSMDYGTAERKLSIYTKETPNGPVHYFDVSLDGAHAQKSFANVEDLARYVIRYDHIFDFDPIP